MSTLKTLQTLASNKPHEAKQAAKALETAPTSETTAALLDLCEREEQKRRQICFRFVGVLSAIAAVGLVLSVYAICTKNTWSLGWLNLFGPLFSFIPFGMSPWSESDKKRRQKYVGFLMASDDPRVLVPMLDTPFVMETGAAKPFQEELSRRLWKLLPDDALVLDGIRRAQIRQLLTRFYSWYWPQKLAPIPNMTDEQCDLVVSALRAVAILGDRKARRPVQRIASTPAKTDNERCVQDVAQECLVILDAQAAEKADVRRRLESLLRDVKVNEDADTLLHPFVESLPPELAKIALVEYVGNRRFVRRCKFWFFQVLLLLVSSTGYLIFHANYAWFHCLVQGIGFFAALARQKPTGGETAAAFALCQYDDVRLVGPLLDAHREHKKSHQIEEGIRKLLPQLRPGDGYLLSPRQRARLRYLVHYSREGVYPDGFPPDLVVGALNALHVVGDTKVAKAARVALKNFRDARIQKTAESLIAVHEGA